MFVTQRTEETIEDEIRLNKPKLWEMAAKKTGCAFWSWIYTRRRSLLYSPLLYLYIYENENLLFFSGSFFPDHKRWRVVVWREKIDHRKIINLCIHNYILCVGGKQIYPGKMCGISQYVCLSSLVAWTVKAYSRVENLHTIFKSKGDMAHFILSGEFISIFSTLCVYPRLFLVALSTRFFPQTWLKYCIL